MLFAAAAAVVEGSAILRLDSFGSWGFLLAFSIVENLVSVSGSPASLDRDLSSSVRSKVACEVCVIVLVVVSTLCSKPIV